MTVYQRLNDQYIRIVYCGNIIDDVVWSRLRNHVLVVIRGEMVFPGVFPGEIEQMPVWQGINE